MGTTWTPRAKVNTTWKGRKKPEIYMSPLQDAYRIVHDQNDKIIYILASSGKLMPATFWTARKPI
jgi:hypothetical protein